MPTKYRWLIGAAAAVAMIWFVLAAILLSLPTPPSTTAVLPTLVNLADEAAQADSHTNFAEDSPAVDDEQAAQASQTVDIQAANAGTELSSPPTVPNLVSPAVPSEPVENIFVLHLNPGIAEDTLARYLASFGGVIENRLDALSVVVIRVPDELSSLPESPILAESEPDYYVGALLTPPSDPYYPSQWNLEVVKAPDGWAALPSNALPVTVAIIDSGICAAHQELEARIAAQGWDFVENDADPQDEYGHGCGVAGVLASRIDNNLGIAGVAPHVRVMSLRVLDAQGIGTYSRVAEALIYAADHAIPIVNLSLGGTSPSSLLEDAVAYAHAKGVMIIAAAGNTGTERVMYPAAYEGVIGVGSVDVDLQRSDFSNYGASVDLYAPGRNIMTLSADGFRTMSGTSLAAPHVAGVAAIEMSLGRALTVDGGVVSVGALPDHASEEPQGPLTCSTSASAAAQTAFIKLVKQRVADPTAVSDSDIAAAREAYLQAASGCFYQVYQQGLRFDGGGYDVAEGLFAQFRLFGTKWGEDSPFDVGRPPATSPGFVVKYSFMNDGVDLSTKEGINPTAALAFSIDSLAGNSATCNMKDEIRAAFSLWAAAANISFQEVIDGGEPFNRALSAGVPAAHIRIGAQVVDNVGNELGHAFFPGPVPDEPEATGTGDIFFDLDENWGCEPGVNGAGPVIDIGLVAIHEVGHAIGMSHQDPNVSAIMNPSYQEALTALQQDDILGVRAVYGSDELGQQPLLTPIVAGDTATLGWTPIGSPELFQVQVTRLDDPEYLNPILNDETLTASPFVTPSLINGSYIWRVRGYKNGWGPWSATNSKAAFIINVSVPTLRRPFNGAVLSNGKVRFEWNAVSGSGTSYFIQVAAGTEFAEPLLANVFTGANISYTLPTALPDGVYFWRVRANSGGFSAPFRFEVDSNVPALNSPPDGAIFNTNTVTLSWPPVAGATEYEVHMDTSPNFVGLLFLDKLFLDKLFLDKLFLDKLFLDKLFLDKLFLDKLFLDKLFLDKLFLDKLFLDKLFLDKLFLDKLFLDKLFLDKLFLDKLFLDKLVTNSVTFNNLTEGDHYWRVRARRQDGTWSGWSDARQFTIHTRDNVIINEIYPGEPAWIELYNNGPTAVDMSGWQFTAYAPGGTIQTIFTFPFGFALQPGAYVTLHEEDISPTNVPTDKDLYIGANTIDWPSVGINGLSIEEATGEVERTEAPRRRGGLGTKFDRSYYVLGGGYDPEMQGGEVSAQATITVTTTSIISANDGQCSIIEAINNANNNNQAFAGAGECAAGSGTDTIVLQSGATYTLTAASVGQTGLPTIASPIIINGNTATITRSLAAPDFRIFLVSNSGNLTLNDLTISNGRANDGGGITNAGSLTLNRVTMTNNSADIFPGSGGGAIYNETGTSITVRDSAFSSNTASDDGGAISMLNGALTVVNTTFSGNSASNGSAILTSNTSTSSFSFVTISGSGAGTAVSQNASSTLSVKNSIIMNNTGANCSGTITNSGGNFGDDGTCTGFSAGSVTLDALGSYGGTTQTHRVQGGSASINSTPTCTDISGTSVLTDQRGVTRVLPCDAGAFEVDAAQTGPTYTVNTTDTVGYDSVCGSLCTLREAIEASNGDGLASTVNLAASQTYTIQQPFASTNALPLISTPIIVNGSGSTITRSSASSFRFFNITGAGSLTLNDLTLTNGSVPFAQSGGAILNFGTVTLNHIILSGNTAGLGAAIHNASGGTANIARSAIYQNIALDDGGGIYNEADMVVVNTTITGNTTNGAPAVGGGIYSTSGNITLNNVTIAGNTADEGGGIYYFGSVITANNTILANNTAPLLGPNCSAAITNGGNNLQFPGTSCGGGIPSADPLLGTLTTTPSPHFPLNIGSPAINAGGSGTCDGLDQLGTVRPQGVTCDIGAFELPEAPQSVNFTVNTINDLDDGLCGIVHCSLREAINAVNADGSVNTISFNISGTGVKTINLTSALPAIIDNDATIDGTAQPGASCASLPPTLLIELNGATAGAGVDGLILSGSGIHVRGLVINRFTANGINITGNNNRVTCSYIGTDTSGTIDLGNGSNGILIQGADNNVIGTNGDEVSDEAEGNLISGNNGSGVSISVAAADTIVAGNIIGLNATGTAALGNSADGVLIIGASTNNRVGTDGNGVSDISERNILSGNNVGVAIGNTSTTGNHIAGNFIGTDLFGMSGIGNVTGIVMNQGATGNTIGGVNAAHRNIVSGNSFVGLLIGDDTTDGNILLNNYIGTDVVGNAALPNAIFGIYLIEADNTIVGQPGAGNLISGNIEDGVSLWNSVEGTIIQGNKIGTTANGLFPLGNNIGKSFGGGVAMRNFSSNNTVGGTGAGEGNLIAFNGVSGISAYSGTGNRFTGNSIFLNNGLGIDLDAAGPSTNDAGDFDGGPNLMQNYPVINTAINPGSQTFVSGVLSSSATTAYTLEFFSSPACDLSGFGEGLTFLGEDSVFTDGSGNANFLVSLGAVSIGDAITVTATDAAGNTSEFSQCVPVTADTTQTGPFNVNTINMNNDGVCGTLHCSLIEAVIAAESNPDASVINLGAGQTYTLTVLDNTVNGPNGLPNITTPITINGSGSTITRPAVAPLFRFFHIDGTGDLSLNDVILQNGNSDTNSGGAIRSDFGSLSLNNVTLSNNVAGDNGGAVAAGGTGLIISNSVLSGNQANNVGGALDLNGGTTAQIQDTTISGNTTSNGGGGIHSRDISTSVSLIASTVSGNLAAQGGGIHVLNGQLTITNSTISGNTAANGGGLFKNSISAVITNSTFAFNNGGGISNIGGSSLNLVNSIVAKNAGNLGPNCAGPMSITASFSTDLSCLGAFNTSIAGLKLGQLVNNGGPTQTHALAPDSPAVDQGSSGPCPLTDQRGVTRDTSCDIGAFEFSTDPVPAVGTRGGAAGLSASGQLQDYVRFGNASSTVPSNAWSGSAIELPEDTDQTIGRDPSSSDANHRTDWFGQLSTRGGQNAIRVVINELFTGTVDAIELYNPSLETVKMTGWQLIVYDGDGLPEVVYDFVAGFEIQPNTYVILREGPNPNDPNQDPLLNLYLGGAISWSDWNAHGAVELTNGASGVDFVRFGDADVNDLDLSSLLPREGTTWTPPSPLPPLPNQSLGRDSLSTDTDAGIDWIDQTPSLGSRNPVEKPAGNDLFADAIVIPTLPFRNIQTTISATVTSAGESAPSCGFDVGHTVWYKYTAEFSGLVRFQTDGSDYNTVISIRSGQSTEIACDDDSGEGTRSRIDLNLTQGTTYFIMVGNSLSGAGNLVFSVLPPLNDDFDSAIAVSSLPFTDAQNTIAASTPLDDPFATCGLAVGRTVWYSFTPQDDFPVRFSTTGSNFDTTISVWTGTRGSLLQIACSDNTLNSVLSTLEFQPIIGTTYYIMVGGNQDFGGNLVFTTELLVPPVNDDLVDAIDVGNLSAPFVFTEDTLNATTEAVDPTPPCGVQLGKSVWFTYTATTNAPVAFDSFNSDYDTTISIWTGAPPSSEIACDDDFGTGLVTSYVEFTPNPGTSYTILVSGYQNEGGSLTFSAYKLSSPPTNDLRNDAILIDPLPFSDTRDTTGATISVGDVAPSCAPSIGRTVWYRYEAGAAGKLLRFQTEGSSFDTVMAVWQLVGADLVELLCDDDGGLNGTSNILMNSGENATLFIQIGGTSGQGGSLQFQASEIPPAPDHDLFGGPRLISSLPYDDEDSTILATSSADDPVSVCETAVGETVWYQYTAPSNQLLVIDTAGSDFDTVISIWTGTQPDNLVESTCNDNDGESSASRVILAPQAGESYFILIGGKNDANGTYHLHVEAIPTPPNDEIGGAINVTGVPITMTDTTGATDHPTDPAVCNATASRTVWYSYTTGILGGPTTLSFSTVGSDYNTVLAVFTGTPGSLNLIACDDNGGENLTSVIAGLKAASSTTYYLMIIGSFGETGTLKLSVDSFTGPANDEIGSPETITSPSYSHTVSTSGATNAVDDPLSCGVIADKTVWYSFQAASSDLLRVTFDGTAFNTVVGIFSGTPGGLTLESCEFFGAVDVITQPGQTYYVMVGGWNGDSGQLTLQAELLTIPANDQNNAPIVIASLPYTNTQSTAGATNTNDPAVTCDLSAGKAVWYQYTAQPGDGLLQFNTQGSDFSTVMAVFVDHGSGLEEIACGLFDGVDVPAVAGETYLIMVAGYHGASGSLTINGSQIGRPSNDDFNEATDIASLPFSDNINTQGASDPASDPLTCAPGSQKSVWYQFASIGSGTVAIDTTGSDFDTVIAVYTGEFGNLQLLDCTNGSSLNFSAQPGQTYFMMIRDADGAGGSLALNLSGIITPALPSVTVTKTADVSSVPESGGLVNFTVEVRNTSILEDVTINSVMDTPFGDLSAFCDTSIPTTLAPNAFFTCSYSQNVGGPANTIYENSVTASGQVVGGDPVSASDTLELNISDVPASLSVTKTPSRSNVREPGQEIVFTVVIGNTSAVDQVTINTVTDTVFGDIGGECELPLPHTLNPGQSLTCEFNGMVSGSSGDIHINTVQVAGTDDDGFAVNASNSATVDVTCKDFKPSKHLKHSDTKLLPPYDNGVIVNRSTDCYYEVGIASYKKFDNKIDNQEIFDYSTRIIGPGETLALTVALPDCAAQVDLFYGDVLLSLNGVRYGSRLLSAVHLGGNNFCEGVEALNSEAPALLPAPEAPSGLTADLNGTPAEGISLTWTDPSEGSSTFHIERLAADGLTWIELAATEAGISQYSDSGVTCGTSYTYRVRAFNGDQFSDFSESVSATTAPCPPPTAPQNLLAAAVSENQIDLAWTSDSGNIAELEMSLDGLNWAVIGQTESTVFSYQIAEPVCGAVYTFRVRAYRQSDAQFSDYSAVSTVSAPACPVVDALDQPETIVGLYRDGVWRFRGVEQENAPEISFIFGTGEAGWQALTGDWNGDGQDDLGLYKDGIWLFRSSAAAGLSDSIVSFGLAESGWQAVAGDWNGDEIDGIGLYKAGAWLLRESATSGDPQVIFSFGASLPEASAAAGDWNHDGLDTPALYLSGTWYLADSLADAEISADFNYGPIQTGWQPIIGDWNHDGIDTVGLYNNGLWRLRNANSDGPTDLGFSFGLNESGWQALSYNGTLDTLNAFLAGGTIILPTIEAPEIPAPVETLPEEIITPEITPEAVITPEVTPEPETEAAPDASTDESAPETEPNEVESSPVEEPAPIITPEAPLETEAAPEEPQPEVTETP